MTSRRIVACGFTLVLGVLAGCGGGGEPVRAGESSPGESKQACELIGLRGSKFSKIIDGEGCGVEPELDTTSIVKVTSRFRNGTVGVCSGTVIGARAVLTAAHCIVEAEPPESVSVSVIVGGAAVEYPAEQFLPHPAYGEHGMDAGGVFFNDSAIILTAEPLPVEPLPILTSRAPAEGEQVAVAGFGLTEPEQRAAQPLHAGFAVLRVVTPNHLFINFVTGESHPCSGDSGGPLLVQTEEGLAVIGDVSQSDPTVDAEHFCRIGDMTLYTNLQNPEQLAFLAANVPDLTVR